MVLRHRETGELAVWVDYDYPNCNILIRKMDGTYASVDGTEWENELQRIKQIVQYYEGLI